MEKKTQKKLKLQFESEVKELKKVVDRKIKKHWERIGKYLAKIKNDIKSDMTGEQIFFVTRWIILIALGYSIKNALETFYECTCNTSQFESHKIFFLANLHDKISPSFSFFLLIIFISDMSRMLLPIPYFSDVISLDKKVPKSIIKRKLIITLLTICLLFLASKSFHSLAIYFSLIGLVQLVDQFWYLKPKWEKKLKKVDYLIEKSRDTCGKYLRWFVEKHRVLSHKYQKKRVKLIGKDIKRDIGEIIKEAEIYSDNMKNIVENKMDELESKANGEKKETQVLAEDFDDQQKIIEEKKKYKQIALLDIIACGGMFVFIISGANISLNVPRIFENLYVGSEQYYTLLFWIYFLFHSADIVFDFRYNDYIEKIRCIFKQK